MLIASHRDLVALLASPACPTSLVTRVDAHHVDPSSPMEPFVGMSFETFEDAEDSGERPTNLDRTLLRHSGRRIVTLHTIADDEEGVESVRRRIGIVRRRLERLAGHRAQYEASWYPIVVFLRRIRDGDIEALRAIQQESLPGDVFRLGRIPTIYVMDRDLSMTTGRELLSSEWVWTRYVVPLLLRLQAVRSDSAEASDIFDVCAWRFLEVGPSMPLGEFEEFFREMLGRWRDERREGESIPWPETHWRIASETDQAVREMLRCRPPELGAFAVSRPRSLTSALEQALPSHATQARNRFSAGVAWRSGVRSIWKQAFGTSSDGTQGGGTGESLVWRKIREFPRMLWQVAARAEDREVLHGRIRRQVERWQEHCRRSTAWHRERVRTLASARLMDEMEAHFVGRGGRLVLASIVLLMIQYLFMAVLEPVIPGVPWWLHAGVVGGGIGAFAAALWSHRSEHLAGESELATLSVRMTPLVTPGLPIETLDMMVEGLEVGAEQTTEFSREVVVALARRATATIGRSDGNLVAGTVTVVPHGQIGDPSPSGRENRMADEAFYIRTHGTAMASERRDRLEEWKEARPAEKDADDRSTSETHVDRFRREIDDAWRTTMRELDPDAVGHHPFVALLEQWKGLTSDLQRWMYESLLIWCADRQESHADDELAARLNSMFLQPSRRTTDPPGRSCQVVRRMDDEKSQRSTRSIALGARGDLDELAKRLKDTEADRSFPESFPEGTWMTPDWKLHGRVILIEEVIVPDSYPQHPSGQERGRD